MGFAELLKSTATLPERSDCREKARAYVRVSSSRSAERNTSPETQRKDIQEYADRNGYVIAEWYEDLGRSAFRDDVDRPEYKRLKEDAKADPDTKVILVAFLDRFSRSEFGYPDQIELAKYDIRIESVTEGYIDPDTPSGAIMGPLLFAMARKYSLDLRAKVYPCMKTNFQDRDPETGYAYKNGGWVLFGFKKDKVYTRKDTKHGDVFRVVWALDDNIISGRPVWEWARTMLLEWRLRDRLGYDAIAGKLTKLGIPTPSGKSSWSPSTIQGILAEFHRLYQYCGTGIWNRLDCQKNKHHPRVRDTSEWIVVRDAHPAIITEQECDDIYAMVEDKKRTMMGPSGQPSRWTFSGGLMVCKDCGQNFAGKGRNGKDYYGCGSHIYRRGEGCVRPSWGIPREELENLVFSRILSHVDHHSELLEKVVRTTNKKLDKQWQDLRSDSRERAENIKALEEQLGDCRRLTSETGAATELANRIRQIEAALGKLKSADAETEPPDMTAENIKALAAMIKEAELSGDRTARQRILRGFVVQLMVDQKEKRIEAKMLDPISFEANQLVAPGHSKGMTTYCL